MLVLQVQWISEPVVCNFFFIVGRSDTSDSVKCHKGVLTYIIVPYVLILCITRDSTGHLEKDQEPYEVHNCSRATASDKKINCCSATSWNQNPLKLCSLHRYKSSLPIFFFGITQYISSNFHQQYTAKSSSIVGSTVATYLEGSGF